MVVVVGGARLRWWWCLALLSCGDMGGGVGFVWLAVGVISCRDYELKRESQGKRECEGREKNIKKVYTRLL